MMFLDVKNAADDEGFAISFSDEYPEFDEEDPSHLTLEISSEEAAFIQRVWETPDGQMLISLLLNAYRQSEEDSSVLSGAFASGAALDLLRGGGPGPEPGTFARLMRQVRLGDDGETED